MAKCRIPLSLWLLFAAIILIIPMGNAMKEETQALLESAHHHSSDLMSDTAPNSPTHKGPSDGRRSPVREKPNHLRRSSFGSWPNPLTSWMSSKHSSLANSPNRSPARTDEGPKLSRPIHQRAYSSASFRPSGNESDGDADETAGLLSRRGEYSNANSRDSSPLKGEMPSSSLLGGHGSVQNDGFGISKQHGSLKLERKNKKNRWAMARTTSLGSLVNPFGPKKSGSCSESPLKRTSTFTDVLISKPKKLLHRMAYEKFGGKNRMEHIEYLKDKIKKEWEDKIGEAANLEEIGNINTIYEHKLGLQMRQPPENQHDEEDGYLSEDELERKLKKLINVPPAESIFSKNEINRRKNAEIKSLRENKVWKDGKLVDVVWKDEEEKAQAIRECEERNKIMMKSSNFKKDLEDWRQMLREQKVAGISASADGTISSVEEGNAAMEVPEIIEEPNRKNGEYAHQYQQGKALEKEINEGELAKRPEEDGWKSEGEWVNFDDNKNYELKNPTVIKYRQNVPSPGKKDEHFGKILTGHPNMEMDQIGAHEQKEWEKILVETALKHQMEAEEKLSMAKSSGRHDAKPMAEEAKSRDEGGKKEVTESAAKFHDGSTVGAGKEIRTNVNTQSSATAEAAADSLGGDKSPQRKAAGDGATGSHKLYIGRHGTLHTGQRHSPSDAAIKHLSSSAKSEGIHLNPPKMVADGNKHLDAEVGSPRHQEGKANDPRGFDYASQPKHELEGVETVEAATEDAKEEKEDETNLLKMKEKNAGENLVPRTAESFAKIEEVKHGNLASKNMLEEAAKNSNHLHASKKDAESNMQRKEEADGKPALEKAQDSAATQSKHLRVKMAKVPDQIGDQKLKESKTDKLEEKQEASHVTDSEVSPNFEPKLEESEDAVEDSLDHHDKQMKRRVQLVNRGQHQRRFSLPDIKRLSGDNFGNAQDGISPMSKSFDANNSTLQQDLGTHSPRGSNEEGESKVGMTVRNKSDPLRRQDSIRFMSWQNRNSPTRDSGKPFTGIPVVLDQPENNYYEDQYFHIDDKEQKRDKMLVGKQMVTNAVKAWEKHIKMNEVKTHAGNFIRQAIDKGRIGHKPAEPIEVENVLKKAVEDEADIRKEDGNGNMVEREKPNSHGIP